MKSGQAERGHQPHEPRIQDTAADVAGDDLFVGELSPEDITIGWLSLFDGESLFGWRAACDADWKVVDREIRVTSGEVGLLRTTTQFDDFILKLEFKATDATNSGVFLRTSPQPTSPVEDCYELNIATPDLSEFSTGALVGREKTDVIIEPGQWTTLVIRAAGGNIKAFVNGNETVNYHDADPLGRGYIGLQHNSGEVAFRNIVIKPIGVTPIFNGENLDGWDTTRKESCEFSVTSRGELRIVDGRGQIESDGEYADFIFSTKCYTGAEGLNSGVFFRCIPDDMMNGYESQIQNQFKNDDPTDPVDCGTGGIFRRSNARVISSRDMQWFSKTIIATGPHVSVWVNGYQVTDWSDTREPDANPRRGRRLEAGTIIFQGHDPTTDILLRDIRARELNPRNR
ncbi:MAG: DUF1080 domain-containing protein [Planctomycetota bacterium]